jgi:hypothetical protein
LSGLTRYGWNLSVLLSRNYYLIPEGTHAHFEFTRVLVRLGASLGFVHYHYDWDWAAAEKEFKRAFTNNL